MEGYRVPLEELISKLDTACGMLLVASIKNTTIREAMEMVTSVSLALGDVSQFEYEDYDAIM